jgi:hypothetical protein
VSPVNLADLPSDQPAPTGLMQLRRGGAATTLAYNNTIASGTLLGAGDGGYMQISVTPARAAWWLLRAQTIWQTPDAAWAYFTWFVSLNRADALGVSTYYAHHCMHSALGWQQSVIDAAFLLSPGVAYTASMAWGSSQGFQQYQYVGPEYTQIMGELIAETVV